MVKKKKQHKCAKCGKILESELLKNRHERQNWCVLKYKKTNGVNKQKIKSLPSTYKTVKYWTKLEKKQGQLHGKDEIQDNEGQQMNDQGSSKPTYSFSPWNKERFENQTRKCDICNLVFTGIEAFLNHVSLCATKGNESVMPRCSICTLKMKMRGSYGTHVTNHFNPQGSKWIYSCRICCVFVLNRFLLSQHLLTHGVKPYVNQGLPMKSDFHNAPKLHSFPCVHCDFSSDRQCEIFMHLRTKHKLDLQADFTVLPVPNIHTKHWNCQLIHNCHQCLDPFQDQALAILHIEQCERKHGMQLVVNYNKICDIPLPETGPSKGLCKSFECKLCNAVFMTQGGILEHLVQLHYDICTNVRLDSSMISCHACNASVTANEYPLHLSQHMSNSQYKYCCRICQTAKSSQYFLYLHLLIHGNYTGKVDSILQKTMFYSDTRFLINFPCAQCEFVTDKQQKIINHLKTKHHIEHPKEYKVLLVSNIFTKYWKCSTIFKCHYCLDSFQDYALSKVHIEDCERINGMCQARQSNDKPQ